MNPIDQAKELLELHGKTTQGEWGVDDYLIETHDGAPICVVHEPGDFPCWEGDDGELESELRANASFIPTAHNAVPSLCQTILDQDKEIERLREAIKRIRRECSSPHSNCADFRSMVKDDCDSALQGDSP